jgi:hypothetical protein
MEGFRIGMRVRFPKNSSEMYVSPNVIGKTGTITGIRLNHPKYGDVADVDFGDGWVQFVPISELEEV